MTETKAPALSNEQIKTIEQEATNFEQKSIELAASSPALSAHYWRLFTACKPSLKRAARLGLTQRNKEAAAKRKNAKEGKASSSKPNAAKP